MNRDKKCCHLCKYQTGVEMIGWFELICVGITIVVISIFRVFSEELLGLHNINDKVVHAILDIIIGALIFYALINIILIIGVRKKKIFLIIPWLISYLLLLMVILILTIIFIKSMFAPNNYGYGILSFFLVLLFETVHIYFCFCLLKSYEEIQCEESTNKAMQYQQNALQADEGYPDL